MDRPDAAPAPVSPISRARKLYYAIRDYIPFRRHVVAAILTPAYYVARRVTAVVVERQRRWRITDALLRARMRPPPPDRILRTWPGAQSLAATRSLAVFCHFDATGTVSGDVLGYLARLSEAGFANIFASGAPALGDEAVTALQPYCAAIIHRRNVGYDFGSYCDGLTAAGDLTAFDRVLIANDSVYGPFEPLETLLQRCTPDVDVWGLTDSQDHQVHLQSYFMLFGRAALANPAFAAFWRSYPFPDYKPAVIEAGELALSRRLQRAGLKLAALFPETATRAAFIARCAAEGVEPARYNPKAPVSDGVILQWVLLGHSLNQTHFFWRDLVALGCPVIKRELIDRNPQRIAGVSNWRAVVAQRFDPTKSP